jgi:hypothetical protein
MSSFTDTLLVEPTADGTKWIIKREFDYHVGHEDSGDIIHIPEGMITDFASIPRVLWSILPPFGRYSQAAVVHDLLCDTRSRPSKETHDMFLEMMTVLGVSRWKKYPMYYGVKYGGPKW